MFIFSAYIVISFVKPHTCGIFCSINHEIFMLNQSKSSFLSPTSPSMHSFLSPNIHIHNPLDISHQVKLSVLFWTFSWVDYLQAPQRKVLWLIIPIVKTFLYNMKCFLCKYFIIIIFCKYRKRPVVLSFMKSFHFLNIFPLIFKSFIPSFLFMISSSYYNIKSEKLFSYSKFYLQSELSKKIIE